MLYCIAEGNIIQVSNRQNCCGFDLNFNFVQIIGFEELKLLPNMGRSTEHQEQNEKAFCH